MTLCPVKCIMHRSAVLHLEAGGIQFLASRMDLFGVLAERAWRRCTCQLWERIQAAVREQGAWR